MPRQEFATPSDLVPVSERNNPNRPPVCKQSAAKATAARWRARGADAAGGPRGDAGALRGSRARAGERCDGGTLDLVAGHVADVLGEAPSMTEGVGYLGVTLAGEPVGRWSAYLRPRGDGAFDEAVDVIGRQVQDG
jgi:hypothetical protein